MSVPFIADKDFKNIDFTKNALQKAEYDNCTFTNCNFNNSYLSTISFLDCHFEDCDLSNSKTKGVIFKDSSFKNCKLLGVLFNHCDQLLLSINFEHCQLDFASFYKVKLSKTTILNSSCISVDFTEAILTESIFDHCDFKNAIFDRTNLEKADFRTAIHYSIQPENNKIKGAKFSKDQIEGLLKHYKINIS